MLDKDPFDINSISRLVKSRGYLTMSIEAMNSVGHAAQTLAAIHDMKDGKTKSTFAAAEKIANHAMLSTKTARRH